jgi:hypothetical protein
MHKEMQQRSGSRMKVWKTSDVQAGVVAELLASLRVQDTAGWCLLDAIICQR